MWPKVILLSSKHPTTLGYSARRCCHAPVPTAPAGLVLAVGRAGRAAVWVPAALSAASPGGFCEAVWWPCSGWGLQSRWEREHPDCGPQRGWNIHLFIAFKTTRCVRVHEEKFRYHIINPQPSIGFKGQKQYLKMDVKGLIWANSGHCCPSRARRSRISSVPCPHGPPPGFDPNLPGRDKLSQSYYTPRGGDLDYYY